MHCTRTNNTKKNDMSMTIIFPSSFTCFNQQDDEENRAKETIRRQIRIESVKKATRSKLISFTYLEINAAKFVQLANPNPVWECLFCVRGDVFSVSEICKWRLVVLSLVLVELDLARLWWRIHCSSRLMEKKSIKKNETKDTHTGGDRGKGEADAVLIGVVY